MTDIKLLPTTPGGTLSDVALMAAGLYIMVAYLRGMPRLRLPKTLHIAILMFLLYGAFSVLKGFYHFGYPSLGDARKTLLFIVFSFYIIAAFRKPDDIGQLLRMIYRVALVVGIVSLGVILKNYVLTGEHVHAIPASGGLLVSTGFLIAVASRMKLVWHPRLPRVNLVPTFLLFFSVVFNAHRSVWVGTFFALGYLFLLRYGALSLKGLVKAGVAISIFTFLSIVGLNLSFNVISPEALASFKQEQLTFISADYIVDESANWRVLAWLQEFERIREKPVFGSGFGNRLTLSIGNQWRHLPSHSGHIEVLSRQGLVGYLIFLFLLFTILKHLNRIPAGRPDGTSYGLMSILTAFIFLSFFYSFFYSFEFFFWLSIGLALSSITFNKKLYRSCTPIK